MTGEARFTYTKADTVALQYAWWAGAARWQTFLLTWAVVLAVYLVLFAGVDFAMGARDKWEGVKVALVLAPLVTVGVFGGGFALAPWIGRRTLKENRLISGEYHWRWGEEALHIHSERGQVNVPWHLFAGWLDAPKVLLIYQTRRMVFALPKRALAEPEVAGLIALLRHRSVPERRRFGVIAAPRA